MVYVSGVLQSSRAVCCLMLRRYIPVPDNDAYSENIFNVTSFSACVDLCNYDPCEFVTYDYLTRTCTRRNGVSPVYVGCVQWLHAWLLRKCML
jgi:hypothetical protein